jgi:hypothetical protein
VRDLAAARAVVRASFGITKFEPGRRAGWPDAYARFLSLAR